MIANVFFSQDLEVLVTRLIKQLDEERIDPFEKRIVLVPNHLIGNWLLLEIAKKKGIAMGIEVLEIGQLISMAPNSLEMFCSIYQSLSNTKESELISYLEGRVKRKIELAKQLSELFFKYIANDTEIHGWQREIFQNLHLAKPPFIQEKIICFGIDSLSDRYWDLLFHAPALSVYLFSPCADFWQECDGPRLLVNWGRLGKETLRIFDSYDLITEELYPAIEPDSMLKQIQSDLLYFQNSQDLKVDDSIKVLCCGASKLNEIQALKEEILSLDLPFHEITVLAPDISPYVPLIEFVFKDLIPYRISGVDIALQSSFKQGLIRLLSIGKGRWDQEEVLMLFETPSFYRKMGWDAENLEQFRSFIEQGHIQWGWDFDTRSQVLQNTFGKKEFEDAGSWEKGLNLLLDGLIYFRKDLQIDTQMFEEFLKAIDLVKSLELQQERSLQLWADCLEKMAELLFVDSNDEIELAAQNAFRSLLCDLRSFQNHAVFPIEVICHLIHRPCLSQIHGSHLHAVHFSSIGSLALVPAKAIFVLGMEEGAFPKSPITSSLNQLKKTVPDCVDWAQYQFLQILFSAKQFLCLSYCHLSEEKPVGPSSLIQELLTLTKDQIVKIFTPPSPTILKKSLSWPAFRSVECSAHLISFSDLRLLAKHPWKFYLQKTLQIYLNERLEKTFALQKGVLSRKIFENEPIEQAITPFEKALQMEALEKSSSWKKQLDVWQIQPFSILFKESCEEPYWEEGRYVVPSLKIDKIELVGEIKYASEKGVISTLDDSIGKAIQIWPEALAVSILFNQKQFWMLKSGKIKEIEDPESALKRFFEYYFHALASPSPLIFDWIDPILRKEVEELEKQMKKESSFEDPIFNWVLARAEIPDAKQIFQSWGPFLKETFSQLIRLYPTRKRV